MEPSVSTSISRSHIQYSWKNRSVDWSGRVCIHNFRRGNKRAKGSPLAQQTELGWILTGTTNSNPKAPTITVQNHFNSLDAQLKRFWEIEENLDERKLSQEEEKCQHHYNQTVKRKNDGRYEVQLPFKNGNRPKLGNSKEAAMARFFQIERKLLCNKKLQEAYTNCVNEYITLGHMKELKTSVENFAEEHSASPCGFQGLKYHHQTSCGL